MQYGFFPSPDDSFKNVHQTGRGGGEETDKKTKKKETTCQRNEETEETDAPLTRIETWSVRLSVRIPREDIWAFGPV